MMVVRHVGGEVSGSGYAFMSSRVQRDIMYE